MFSKVDHWILDRVEHFCHWFQRLTGLTNFWWARACMTTIWICNCLITAEDATKKLVVALHLFALLVLGVVLLCLLHLHAIVGLAEKHYHDGASTAHRITLAFRNSQSRIPVALFFGFLAFRWGSTMLIGGVSQVGMSYFLSVIPLPPGKSKIQEWREALQAGCKKMAHAEHSLRISLL
jgi:hypothetical protein